MTSPYAPPSPDLRPPPAPGRGKPVPVLAMLLSFCAVGLGHVYAGRPKRAVVWVVLPLGFYVYLGLAVRYARGGAFLAGVMLLFGALLVAWAGAVIDAGRMAAKATGPRASIPVLLGAWVLLQGVPIGSALLTRRFVVEAYKIPSGSMMPSLLVGDHIFIDKSGWAARRGDIIVFPFPEHPEQDFVKRAVAVAGDVVSFRKGHTVLGGVEAPSCRVGEWTYEEAASETPTHNGEIFVEVIDARPFLVFFDSAGWGPFDTQGPWTVKPGEVFVVGDNRYNAHDSRMWLGGQGGGVPVDTVRGKALVVWLSVDAQMDHGRTGLSLDHPHLPASAASLQPALDDCLHRLGVP